jgi:membrane-bound lytic murein transglycosylase D
MRRGGFYAGLVGGGVLLAGAVLAVATRPSVRATAAAFLAPLPSAPSLSHDAGVAPLPVEPLVLGAESPELVALRSGDAGAPPPRAPRRALFATEPGAPLVTPPNGLGAVSAWFRRPDGLRRTPLAERDDPRLDPALAYLERDEHGHGALLGAIKRSGRCREEVARILRAWKIPEDLAAVVFTESAFAPAAASTDGGTGLWGLSGDVAAAYGLVTLPSFDERRSVSVSTEGAAHYLSDLRERLGSWELALYAFGAGYVPALADLQTHAQATFWTLARELPRERVTYVTEVLAVATVLGNLDRFGFGDVRAEASLATSDLEVPAGASFSTVARASGTTAARLHELNPEYLGESVPATGFAMVMHLPSAGLARAKEMLMPLLYATPGSGLSRGGSPAATPDAAAAPGTIAAPAMRSHKGRFFYKIQEGDTLDSVAARFKQDKQTIALDNALDPSAGLEPGQLLTIRPPDEGDSNRPTP